MVFRPSCRTNVLVGCDLLEFEHCSNKCPSQPAMLGFLRKGYYPSAPKRPNFAISEDILHFYHDMFTHGSVSKRAFCIAIQLLTRRKGPKQVYLAHALANLQLAYQLYKPLLSVYSTWVDIQLILQTMARGLLHHVSYHGNTTDLSPSVSHIGLDPESIRSSALRTSVPLNSLCPACFGREPSPEFAVVCFDGNMQQKRTTTARNDSRYASDLRLLFVENSFQSKDDASEACFCASLANHQEKQEDETTTATCSRNFRAASDYKVSEKFADNGVVAGCCRHDIVLRLHNISGTGERLLYAFRLLQSILDDPDCPQRVVIFYDINCKFSKYLEVCLLFSICILT